MKNTSISKKPSNDSAVKTLSSRRALLIKTFGALLIEDNPVFKELYDEYKTRMSALDPARSEVHLQVGAVRFCVKAFLNYLQEKKGKFFGPRSTVDKIKQSGKITYNPFMLAKITSMIDVRPINIARLAYSASWVDDEKN